MSIPVGLAAGLRRIPLVLHEQNSVPGIANRAAVALRLGGRRHLRGVRSALRPPRPCGGHRQPRQARGARRRSGRRPQGAGTAAGGHRPAGVRREPGSASPQHCADRHARQTARDSRIFRSCTWPGRPRARAVRAALYQAGGDGGGRWRVLDYLDDMGSALAACDLVVARAGATSIAEITALGLPSVLVPYPYATDDHQTKNAAITGRSRCGRAHRRRRPRRPTLR